MKHLLLISTLALLASCAPRTQSPTAESITLQADDTALLDRVQQETFNYFWLAGEPTSGAARERYHADETYGVHGPDVVTSGGTGFGIMATLVGIERGFITREQAYKRLQKLTNWLEDSDRFHGAWPHWWNPDGSVYPFSQNDDGGDLVETAFLVQGLITARQYFKTGNKQEKALALQMDRLWKEVEWDWYTQGQDVLYWHWSPKFGFEKDFAVRGHNECMIMYVLAAASPTHGIDADVYRKGYAKDGAIYTDREFYGLPTVFDHYDTNDMPVGPLFWAHYSHLGLNPKGLKDGSHDYWQGHQNHALIHYRHATQNPNDYRGYSEKCWGMTSSYSMSGYSGHNPHEDLGVISPTAALSSFPYTPVQSMQFLKYLYQEADSLVGPYGPYDAFSHQSKWYVKKYLAIDQLPIPVMIENYRSGLLWNLFMSSPEVQRGLDKLGLDYQKVNPI